uniref:hypothetical protein n=1 Tax=Catenella fusiformis TaxID=3024791 RepID=UPI0027DA9387|nr:hypothetical protein REQ04_pgp138 [Catenella fusiformis]WCH57489.1 hypothetical protein [Catenella fusiformis]
MDNSYCIIQLTSNTNISLYSFFLSKNRTNNYPLCLTASTAEAIYYLMSLHKYFAYLSFSHHLYLAKELYKAELALIFKQIYIQK